MNSLAQVAGQVLTIGFEGETFSSDVRTLLETTQPGGVIFFQRNVADERQFAELAERIRRASLPATPLLTVDLEGGTVDRFRSLLGPLPSVADAVACGAAYELGRLAGRELAAFGLNVDFAPVLDLGLPASREVLASRTAGGSAEAVAAFAREFLAGLSESNVAGCGKHFPGLGGGNLDSHLKMPSISRNFDEMWNEDLYPYRRLDAALPMVMVAHAWYPELERELGGSGPARPASLSPLIVLELLRKRLRYSGLVLCDDLEMGGVLGERSIQEAAIAAIEAGCDVLLICKLAGNVHCVHEALVMEAERNSQFRKLLEAAAGRAQEFKYRLFQRAAAGSAITPTVAQVRAELADFRERIQLQLARIA